MEVAVVGGGSVGLLVASFLSEADHQVTLFVRRKEQSEELNTMGIHRHNLDQTVKKTKVQATTNIQEIPDGALVIVATKYEHLQSIYSHLKILPQNTPLLFLQNGLAHFEQALQLPQETIAFGSCQFGAQKNNDYTVVHRGLGVMKLAIEKGVEKQKIHNLFARVNRKFFQYEFVDHAEQMLFEKAILNSFINPMTAILQVKNGFLVENQYAFQMLMELFKELKSVFPNEMDKFEFDDVKKLALGTATNTSSMLGDVYNCRKTEVETIVGSIIERATKMGKTLPRLSTLYYLIKAIEERSENM
nr:2-dehydropantoate 2-reductase [Lysinibacillus timonensis]